MNKWTDDDGNVHQNNGHIEVIQEPGAELVTVICRNNPVLFNKLIAVIKNEYGNTVTVSTQINGFGDDLAHVTPSKESTK